MNRQAVTAAVVAAAVVLIALLVFYLYPSATVPPDSGAPEVTDVERGDSAREAIADLQDDGANGQVDYAAAFERGQEFREDGRLADAQLMYFFAARGGHPQAAFELGTMNDPLHHDPGASLMAEPDPFQAYKWYTQALEGGVSAASARLDALREWAEREAQTANTQAEQLLLQWN